MSIFCFRANFGFESHEGGAEDRGGTTVAFLKTGQQSVQVIDEASHYVVMLHSY